METNNRLDPMQTNIQPQLSQIAEEIDSESVANGINIVAEDEEDDLPSSTSQSLDNYDDGQYYQAIKDKWDPMLLSGAREDNMEMIILALKNGAQIGHSGPVGWDSLCWASNNGNPNMVAVLIDKGSLDQEECKYIRLETEISTQASAENDIDSNSRRGTNMMAPLDSHSSSRSSNNRQRRTIAEIQLPTRFGTLKRTRKKGERRAKPGPTKDMIVRGAKVEGVEPNPLRLAAVKGHHKVVAILMKAGVDSEAIDEFGNSIFHSAAASNDPETFKVLVQLGADLHLFNSRGHSPLEVTTNTEIQDIILEWRNTDVCTISEKSLEAGVKKFWCVVCRKFFHESSIKTCWEQHSLESEDLFKPETLCSQCQVWRGERLKAAEDLVKAQDFLALTDLRKDLENEGVPMDVKFTAWLDYETRKLEIQKGIRERLEKLERVEDYKTIMKSKMGLEEVLLSTERERVRLDEDMETRVRQQIQRLDAERELRYFLDKNQCFLGPSIDKSAIEAKLITAKKKASRRQRVKNNKGGASGGSKKTNNKNNKNSKGSKNRTGRDARSARQGTKEQEPEILFNFTIEQLEKMENPEKRHTKEELQALIDESDRLLESAKAYEVGTEYLGTGDRLKTRLEKCVLMEDIVEMFQDYPQRTYPPDPLWDPRGKRWLDAVTKKPLDPKKPVILPLNPPKKKKKKSKKKFLPEYPEWAQERNKLIEMVDTLEELLVDSDISMSDEAEEDRVLGLIMRMHQELKFRLRIEKDLRLIEELQSKTAKPRR